MSRLLLVVAILLPLTVAHASADSSSGGVRGKIVFSSELGPNVNNPEIYSIQVDGSQHRNLTQNQGWDTDFAVSPTGDRIAFVSYRPDSPPQLYVMRADGSDQHGLTPQGVLVRSPTWSPDGRRLAFAGSGQDPNATGIWVVDADGTSLRQVTHDGYSPVWSPSGNRVAFISDAAVDVVHVDTGDRVRLADNSVGSPPTWSPDGRSLAFARSGSALYKVDADGGTPELVVSDEAHGINNPAWSPTGAQIAFAGGDAVVRTVDASGGAAEVVSEGERPVWSPDGRQIASAGYSKVFVANADGTGSHVVRDEPRAFFPFGPAWSPDGHTLLYASEILNNDSEVFTVNADGSQRRQLTKNRVDDIQATWSPDHKRIAFVRKTPAGRSLWIMSATGGHQRRLRFGTHPSWSPDGKRLALQSVGSIYTMNDRGRAPRLITEGEQPVWAPRGRRIAFLRGTKLFVVDTRTRRARLLANLLDQCAVYGEGDRAATPSTPEWSPRGRSLVISVYCDYTRSSYVKVWIVDAGGAGVIGEVPVAVAAVTRLAWSPDGRRLAFSIPGGGDLYHFQYRTIDTALLNGDDRRTVTTDAGDDVDADW